MAPSAKEIATEQVTRTLEACTASYSGWVFEALRIVSVDVENVGVHTPAGEEEPRLKPEKGKARATVTVELDVTPEMTNLSGNMHGGCTATLLDMVSSLPLIALSDLETWRSSGVSQNFNVLFLAPIPSGSTIRIITSSITVGKRSAVTECRFVDCATGKMLACGNHTKVEPFGGKTRDKQSKL